LQVDKLGHFMMKVPSPLAIGTVELEGDASCLGFVAEGWIAGDKANQDITHLGSWLKYVES
jgi:allophanate hydrolase